MFTNDTMIQKNINGTNYLQFRKLLDLGINHCFALKELNFSFKLQPLKKTIESFTKVSQDLNFNLTNMSRKINSPQPNGA